VRVLHVSIAYPPATAWTGPISQLHARARAMRSAGIDARVVATDADERGCLDVDPDRWLVHEGVPVFYAHCWNKRYFLAPSAWGAIRREAQAADIVHLVQAWSWLTIAAARHANAAGKPLVLSPCGGFDPNARAFSSRTKAVFGALGGGRAIRSVAGFHVTSARERLEVEAFVPGKSIEVIPNGVLAPSPETLRELGPPDSQRRSVVFLGRLHPVKNLPLLLRSWAQVSTASTEARLVIVGPDENGHREELEALSRELRLARVTFSGPVSGAAKVRLLASAWCVVLPSQTENFGNVVAESLACGTPVIASTGTPWSELERRRCGWWIEPQAKTLAMALSDALAMGADTRQAMAERARAWVLEAFAFESIANRMALWYERLVRASIGKVGVR
jgi:glycosyltransferase involved in cell wall biosynthesis